MSRLTKKDIEGSYDFTYSNGEFVRGICPLGEHPHQEIYSNGLNKLGKLEDLEEELGCPLEVFFKMLKERNYYFEYNEKVYYNKNCYINTVNVDDGFISVSVSNEELRNKYIFDVKLFFKDYKKTWWLKEDKSE